MLGEALGLDLEPQAEEVAVGPFSLDLLARAAGINRQVVIENQLEDTNHDHLGKLLTYASGFDSEVVVWIAKKFRDEHREALNWLNHRTGEDTAFFGVVVELLRINESPPAPYFKVVLAPDDWHKSSGGDSQRSAPSERMERYRMFFQPLFDALREKHSFTDAEKAQPQNWYNFSAGIAGITYSASFAAGNRAKVGFNLDGRFIELNKQRFDWLKERKDSIEADLGQLEWRRMNDKIACRIELNRSGSIDDNEETLNEIRDWMITNLLEFRRVFGPSIEDLRNVGRENRPA